MKNDYENILNVLNSANNPNFAEKVPDLQKIADSKDGQRLKEKFDSSEEVKKVMESGDVNSLQCLLTSVLQTEEGKRIAKQLSDMMK
jgi:Methionyl-tRNA synthetase